MYSTRGLLSSVVETSVDMKVIYSPLYKSVVTVYSDIGEGSISLFDKSYEGVSSIGSGVLYSVGEIPSVIVLVQKDTQVANVGSFWDSFIDKISDNLIPLFKTY